MLFSMPLNRKSSHSFRFLNKILYAPLMFLGVLLFPSIYPRWFANYINLVFKRATQASPCSFWFVSFRYQYSLRTLFSKHHSTFSKYSTYHAGCKIQYNLQTLRTSKCVHNRYKIYMFRHLLSAITRESLYQLKLCPSNWSVKGRHSITVIH